MTTAKKSRKTLLIITVLSMLTVALMILTSCNKSDSDQTSSSTSTGYSKHEFQGMVFEIPSELKEDDKNDNYYYSPDDKTKFDSISISAGELKQEISNEALKSREKSDRECGKNFNPSFGYETSEKGKIFIKDREGLYFKQKLVGEVQGNGSPNITMIFNVKNHDDDDIDYLDKEEHNITVIFSGKYATEEQMHHFIDTFDFKDR